MSVKCGAFGTFRVVKERKGEVTLDQTFDNVILNVGFDALFTPTLDNYRNKRFRYLFLGTGTTEPSRTDTGLESRSGTLVAKGGSVTNNYCDSNNTDQYHYFTASFQYSYGEGQAEGVWTELGVAGDTSYVTPMNRALFRDDLGNAISLTVLSDEFLTVFYDVTIWTAFMDGTQQTGTTTLNGTSVGYSIHTNPSAWVDTGGGVTPRNFFGQTDYTSYTVGYFAGGTVLSNGKLSTYGDDHYRLCTDNGANTVSSDIVVDPTGSDYTFDRINFGSNWHPFSRVYPAFEIVFDTPITKLADERLTIGTCSLTFVREATDTPPGAA